MSATQALVRTTTTLPNGNGHDAPQASSRTTSPEASPAALTDELVNDILKGRGLRGWWRLVRVARVLGLFTLYLYLDTYEVRAGFNRRMSERRLDASSKGLLARADARCRDWLRVAREGLIRALRFVVFRGQEGSSGKAVSGSPLIPPAEAPRRIGDH